ncbi:MAG: hypothetical protein ACR2F6_00150 [Mycobacteriales bacterium]
MMRPATERATGRYPAVLLGLGIIAAVFAMHGPSSDHMLLMPTSTPVSGAVAHQPPARSMDHGRAVRSDDRQAALPGGVAVCGVGHADCVATLRHGAMQPAPPSFAAAILVSACPGGVRAATAPVSRAPPRPGLDRLCISRT